MINEDNPKFKHSFISLGSIKKIENHNEKNVILYSSKSTLKSSLELKDMIKEIATQKVKFTPNLDSGAINLKNLIYELLNLTELFEPVTPYNYLVKKQGNCSSIKGKLAYLKSINNDKYIAIKKTYSRYDKNGKIF